MQLAQVQRFMLHSQEPNYRRSAAELEEEELSVGLLKRQIQIIWGLQQDWRRQGSSVLDGCVLWGASMVVLPPGKERVIHELCKIHVHPGIGRMKRLARSRVCMVGKPQWRSGSQSANLYQVSVKSTPRINLMPRPSRTMSCEKEGLVFWVSHGAG